MLRLLAKDINMKVVVFEYIKDHYWETLIRNSSIKYSQFSLGWCWLYLTCSNHAVMGHHAMALFCTGPCNSNIALCVSSNYNILQTAWGAISACLQLIHLGGDRLIAPPKLWLQQYIIESLGSTFIKAFVLSVTEMVFGWNVSNVTHNSLLREQFVEFRFTFKSPSVCIIARLLFDT